MSPDADKDVRLLEAQAEAAGEADSMRTGDVALTWDFWGGGQLVCGATEQGTCRDQSKARRLAGRGGGAPPLGAGEQDEEEGSSRGLAHWKTRFCGNQGLR